MGITTGNPPHLLPFLKSVEKGATTLVLFAYAMYAMLYLLLPSGVYFLLPSGGLYLCTVPAERLAKRVVCTPSRRRKP